jgi:hypothetical protein
MRHHEIELSTMEKSLTFETLSRDLGHLDQDSLLDFACCYLKLYLKQQETLQSLPPLTGWGPSANI